MKYLAALALTLGLAAPACAQQTIGSVSTNFRLVGPNDKVIIQRIDDPKVANVSCYVSTAQTGGVSGSIGVATNPSQFAIFLHRHRPCHHSRQPAAEGADGLHLRLLPVQAFHPHPHGGHG